MDRVKPANKLLIVAYTQPLYGPFSWTTQVSRCLLWCREENRGRHTDYPAGRHSIRTNQWPASM